MALSLTLHVNVLTLQGLLALLTLRTSVTTSDQLTHSVVVGYVRESNEPNLV